MIWFHEGISITISELSLPPKHTYGVVMKRNLLDILKIKICGRRIVSVEPSKWSGEVKSLIKNHDYVSITLDDGTILEVGGLYIREGRI